MEIELIYRPSTQLSAQIFPSVSTTRVRYEKMINIGCKIKRIATICQVRLKRLAAKSFLLDVAIIRKRDKSVRKVVYANMSAITWNRDIQQYTSSLNSSLISKNPTVIWSLIRMNILKILTIPHRNLSRGLIHLIQISYATSLRT